METLQELETIAMKDTRWAACASVVIGEQYLMEAVVALEAAQFVADVQQGSVDAGELRRGLRWANALDAEAVAVFGADTTVGEQQEERVARRIMHHAGRTAVEELNRIHQRQTRSNVERNSSRTSSRRHRRVW